MANILMTRHIFFSYCFLLWTLFFFLLNNKRKLALPYIYDTPILFCGAEICITIFYYFAAHKRHTHRFFVWIFCWFSGLLSKSIFRLFVIIRLKVFPYKKITANFLYPLLKRAVLGLLERLMVFKWILRWDQIVVIPGVSTTFCQKFLHPFQPAF
jgi:hypothetical protein